MARVKRAGFSIEGLDSTLFELDRLEDRTNKKSLRALRRGAKQIQQRAIAYAPVDEGNLERAIVTREERYGPYRITIQVGVDETLLGDGYQIHGYRYDVRMHEDYSYKLGPKSLAKQLSTGMHVGPGYLLRAFEDFESGIDRDIKQAIMGEVRRRR